MSRKASSNSDAIKLLQAEIKEQQRIADMTKRIVEREYQDLLKIETRIMALKLAVTQLESAYD